MCFYFMIIPQTRFYVARVLKGSGDCLRFRLVFSKLLLPFSRHASFHALTSPKPLNP